MELGSVKTGGGDCEKPPYLLAIEKLKNGKGSKGRGGMRDNYLVHKDIFRAYSDRMNGVQFEDFNV